MGNSVFLRGILSGFFVLATAASAGAQTLLVVNQGSSNLGLIDPATGTQTATVEEGIAGVHAHEVAVSADGRTAYIPIYGSTGLGKPGLNGREMLVVDLQSRKVVGDVDFGHEVRPHQPVFSQASGLLYVTTELDKTVTVIDPRTRKIVGSIPTGQEQSHMLAVSHDGKRGYTANVGPGTVSVLDLPGRKTLAIIPVADKLQRISVSNDDALVFTADQTRPRLAVIDATTKTVKTWIPMPGVAFGTAATRDGRWLLAALPDNNRVAVVDLRSMRVTRTVEVPSSPQEILTSPDGKVAYVSCNTSGTVAEIDLAQWKVSGLIAAGKQADGLGWAQ